MHHSEVCSAQKYLDCASLSDLYGDSAVPASNSVWKWIPEPENFMTVSSISDGYLRCQKLEHIEVKKVTFKAYKSIPLASFKSRRINKCSAQSKASFRVATISSISNSLTSIEFSLTCEENFHFDFFPAFNYLQFFNSSSQNSPTFPDLPLIFHTASNPVLIL